MLLLRNRNFDHKILADVEVGEASYEVIKTKNCYVNNGGCSHICDVNICKCPPCWEMGDDQLTCRPMETKMVTNCYSDRMEIVMDRCVLENYNVESAKPGFQNLRSLIG